MERALESFFTVMQFGIDNIVSDGMMSTNIPIDFCNRLIKSAGRKAYLLQDNLRVHHAELSKAWLKQRQN